MTPGPKNSITDITGLKVGNAQDERLKSGVTALICDEPFTASISVQGGGPGTRDTELLRPENTVPGVDALFLSGGSVYGLDAGSGVQAFLREQNRGFPVGPMQVPISPGAIIFDLINGGKKDWERFSPYNDLGYQAAKNAATDFDIGSVGAGTGALVAGLKGGLGTASLKLESGVTVAALFAVNSLGNPLIGETAHFHAAPFEKNAEFGGLGLPTELHDDLDKLRIKFRDMDASVANTTIGIVATDAELTKSEAKRMAISAHDGIARAIWPAHTPMDGDLVFALATGKSGIKPEQGLALDIFAHAASVSARAIARGVYSASAKVNDIFPVYEDPFLG